MSTKRFIKPIIKFGLVLLTGPFVFGQNLDLLTSYSFGQYRGMGGAGLALSRDLFAIDLNPAGLSHIKTLQAGISVSGSLHDYQLINERVEEELARIFKWQKLSQSLNSMLFALPYKTKAGLGFGYAKRISPYLYNQRRAITWSPLFNQQTDGGLSSVLVSWAYQYSPLLSIGMTGYHYFGAVKSVVHGENHDQDVDKWAKIASVFSGNSLRAGLQYQTEKLRLGLTIEPPSELNIELKKSISRDSLYVGLFPGYSNTSWDQPFTIGLGVAYRFDKNTLLALDLEARHYKDSEVSFNLFEYGESPEWADLFLIRVGLEKEQVFGAFPLRTGYALIPQLYTSTTIHPPFGETAVLEKGAQNLKQVLSLGTSHHLGTQLFHLAFEYSWLRWERELSTYITVNDECLEQAFVLSFDWIYSL